MAAQDELRRAAEQKYRPDLTDMPEIICRKCRLPMEPAETYFEYLDHGFHTKLLRCPGCGEVYIPEDLVRGKMAEVEQNLEDK